MRLQQVWFSVLNTFLLFVIRHYYQNMGFIFCGSGIKHFACDHESVRAAYEGGFLSIEAAEEHWEQCQREYAAMEAEREKNSTLI